MAASSVIAKRYFEALNNHDIDAAIACWAPGAGDESTTRFGQLLASMPDLWVEIIDTTTQRDRCIIRWRALGTFIGPERLDGFAPNGARVSIEGVDALHIAEDRIVAGEFYMDGAELLQQLGVLPPVRRIAAVTNLRTWTMNALYGSEPEAIAAGVWVLRGGRPRRAFNAYLIEDERGLTVFDPGISQMAAAIRVAGARFGGIKRVILSHADSPHRGAAAGLHAPIYCHALERSAAQAPSPYRDYWDLGLLGGFSRAVLTRMFSVWDGGPLEIEGTLKEGDPVAGFKVIDLPGHAPGLIGLWREEDGLALVSDAFYTVNPQTGLRNDAHVPHPAFNLDTNQARDSIRRLATLNPSVLWPGLAKPVSGNDIDLQLQRAASAAV
jgi:glyoxylase-like metal-dependent hydrolase (beta-lactamase superfamily II)